MYIRSAADLGKIIRAYRLYAKLTQAQLASLVGTTQDWISQIERGKETAEVGLVLLTLNTLKVSLFIPPPGISGPQRSNPLAYLQTSPDIHESEDRLESDYPDIDEIVDRGGS